MFDICTEERLYHLASETEEERREWIATLNNLLFEDPLRRVCFSSDISISHSDVGLVSKALVWYMQQWIFGLYLTMRGQVKFCVIAKTVFQSVCLRLSHCSALP